MRIAMKTLRWRLCFCLMLLGTAACNTIFVPRDFKLHERALEKLNLYYTAYIDSLGREFAFCCYGSRRADTLVVADVEIPPKIHYPDSVARIRFDLCRPGW